MRFPRVTPFVQNRSSGGYRTMTPPNGLSSPKLLNSVSGIAA